MPKKIQDSESGSFVVLASLGTPLIGLAVRFIATVIGVFRYPARSIRAIPHNWVRQALAIDIVSVPEIIPGEGRYKTGVINLHQTIRILREYMGQPLTNPGETVVAILIGGLILILGYIPALAFRISFKATAVVYFPFIWVAQFTNRKVAQPQFIMQRLVSGELEKSRRWFSGIVLIAFFLRLGLQEGWIERKYVVEWIKGDRAASALLENWEWWQYSLMMEVAFTFLLFYYADSTLAKIKSGLIEGRHASTLLFIGMSLRSIVAAATVILALISLSPSFLRAP